MPTPLNPSFFVALILSYSHYCMLRLIFSFCGHCYVLRLIHRIRYTLTFVDRTGQNCKKTGTELMETGLNVSGFVETQSSDIVWINY